MTRHPTDDEGAEPEPGGWAICLDCLGAGNNSRGSEERRPVPWSLCLRCEGEGLVPAERQTGDNDNDEPLAP